jgi:hypothetical protein
VPGEGAPRLHLALAAGDHIEAIGTIANGQQTLVRVNKPQQ